MDYTIYKITNLINNKIYVGAHKTANPNDDYFGSGIAIQRAIQKHGKENFKKDILFIFDNEVDMYKKEREIVTEKFVQDNATYNMTIGGAGSWSHIDSSGENNPMHKSNGRSWKDGKTQEEIDEINSRKASHGQFNGMYGKTHSDEVKKKLSDINSKPFDEKFDKEKADDIKRKMSESAKGKTKSKQHKRKMSESAKLLWDNMPILVCPYCSKEGKERIMKRYHFEKCKNK